MYYGGRIPIATPAAEPCWSHPLSSITPPGGLHQAHERTSVPDSVIPLWGLGGRTSSSGGAGAPVAARPTPPFCPAGGPLVPPWPEGLLANGGGSSLPRGGGGASFEHSKGPAQTRGGADLKHTCHCPRCMVHYETCILSLMAQVQDLRTQNQELQRSNQELSQALATAAGFSQCYGDRMAQILSTLVKYDTAVQGYQRDSRAVAASVADHLKMTNSNTAKCFSAVETLATCHATAASRI